MAEINGSIQGSDLQQHPDEERVFSEHLIAVSDPLSAAAEAYRTLRTNLFYALVDNPPKVIVLTSPGPGEGKSTTCANLGVVMAQTGKSVLVLDCDLRRPTMHRIFGLRNFNGLVDILVGSREPREVLQEPLHGLKVLTVGSVPPNPAELLGSKRFADFLSVARKEFDYVLVDAPPVGVVSDPIILSTEADGVLLVVDAQSSRKWSLSQGIRSLQGVGAKVLGTVMNRVPVSKGSYYGYSSYAYR